MAGRLLAKTSQLIIVIKDFKTSQLRFPTTVLAHLRAEKLVLILEERDDAEVDGGRGGRFEGGASREDVLLWHFLKEKLKICDNGN